MSLGAASVSESGLLPLSESTGQAIHDFASTLYPICRSITGDGVRETLRLIGERIPLEIHEVPTGTEVLDWTVPQEWNIRDAWVKNSRGERVIDFQEHNLHVLGYSVPVRSRMSLAELREHLFTLPDHPDWIPYRTSYYHENWGFCLRHRDYERLPEDEYEVCIDSTLEPGSLTYGEFVLPGKTNREILFSCHVCHPSLFNDNMAGVAVATFLASALRARSLRHTVRILFIPGTIGAITWLARNRSLAPRIDHGLVLTCLGDEGHSTYKRSRRGTAPMDLAMEHVLRSSGQAHEIVDFSPYGYDERQYCSPGFNLPVGCLMRSQHGTFPEYHTSADDPEFVKPDALADSLTKILEAIEVVENDGVYENLSPHGEPQLGRRGLYDAIGGTSDARATQMAMLWVLNLSDGGHTLLEIANRSGMRFSDIHRAATLLQEHALVRKLFP